MALSGLGMSAIDASPRRFPLFARVLAAGAAGAAVGAAFGSQPIVFGIGNAHLGELGMALIRLLKCLAGPLLFLSVVDATVATRIPLRKGALLVGISLANAVVALVIGLGIVNGLEPGSEQFAGMQQSPEGAAPAAQAGEHHPEIAASVPDNLVDPFRRNEIIVIALLALLAGLSLRSHEDERGGPSVLRQAIGSALSTLTKMLGILVSAIPVAVFGVVASVVSKSGWDVLRGLIAFLATILGGLALQAVAYYGLLLKVAGRTSPLRFYREAGDAIAMALSSSSSLATLPVTLATLAKMGVSTASARLAACVGTNLNHAGVILYEAAATVFVAQAFGIHLSVAEQVHVGLAAAAAGVGIAGVPEAGLITLPVVLGAAGLPASVCALAVPLLLPVDWILGRCRAATNVLSDMTVATLLDRFEPDSAQPSPISST